MSDEHIERRVAQLPVTWRRRKDDCKLKVMLAQEAQGGELFASDYVLVNPTLDPDRPAAPVSL